MQSYGLHIAIYGDAGRGNREQFQLGRAMAQRHALKPFHLALSTGDNQYDSTHPAIMEQIFEKPFAALIAEGVRFYQTPGNHDMDEGRIEDQLAYSAKLDAQKQGPEKERGGWVLPAEHYVIQRGPVCIIVLNVTAPDSAFPSQESALEFARRELSARAGLSEWTIVCFHYHLWSTGLRGDHEEMLDTYLPLFEEFPVDFVVAGHEHHAEFFAPWKGMHFALVGNGSEIRRQKVRSSQPCLFRTNDIGFAELSLEPGLARFAFINQAGHEIWSTRVQKAAKVGGLETVAPSRAPERVAGG